MLLADSGNLILGTATESVNTEFPNCSDLYTISPTGSDRRRITDNCPRAPLPTDSGAQTYSPSWQPLP